MTDTIKKLRSLALKLHHLGDGQLVNDASDTMGVAAIEIEKMREEIERLSAALKPFALEAKAYDPPEGDDEHPAWASRFTCGNLRDARNALEASHE